MMQRMRRWIHLRPWLAKGMVVALALAAVVAILPLGISAYALSSHKATSSGWTIVPDATKGAPNNYLYASATIASNDAWVGGYDVTSKGAVTLFEHWNGAKWTIVGSPNPGSVGDYIYAMAADRSTDVWAIGGYNTSTNSFPLVEHWNGVRWYSIFSPNPPNGSGASLTGIAALSATDAWITGSYLPSGSKLSVPFVEHWNGMRWSFVAIPGLGRYSYDLNALKGISGSNVWAVGTQYPNGSAEPLAMHWDGVQWKVVPMVNPGIGGRLTGIVAITSTDVWAVGYEYPNSHSATRSLAEHWNGSSWQVVYTPTINSEQTIFTGVAATSSKTVWAVGYTNSDLGTPQGFPFIDEWNGTNWTAVSIPVGPSNASAAHLLAVSGMSQGGVWAVGFLQPVRKGYDTTLILRHS